MFFLCNVCTMKDSCFIVEWVLIFFSTFFHFSLLFSAIHEKIFIVFMVTSLCYMLLNTIIFKWTRDKTTEEVSICEEVNIYHDFFFFFFFLSEWSNEKYIYLECWYYQDWVYNSFSCAIWQSTSGAMSSHQK